MQDAQKVYEAVASAAEVMLLSHAEKEGKFEAVYRHEVGDIYQALDKPALARLPDDQAVVVLTNDLLARIRQVQRGDKEK